MDDHRSDGAVQGGAASDGKSSDGAPVGTSGGAVIDTRGALSVALSSGVAGVSGLVVVLLAARVLTVAQNSDFLVFWSALFAGYAVLGGVQQESTRGVGVVTLEPARARARVLPVALGVGAAIAFLVVVTAPWWRDTLMPGRHASTVLAGCLSLLLYAGHLAVVGSLLGRRRWHHSSALIAAEAVVRLVLVVTVLMVAAGLDALELAVAAPAAVWLVAMVAPTVRRAGAARTDVPVRRSLAQIGQAMAAAVGIAVLVVGFPTVMRATTDAQTWSGAAPLVLAITLTRAVLIMPLNAFQGVTIGYFLDPRRPRVTSLVRLVGVVLAVGVVMAGLVALVGPPLLGLVRPEYAVDAWLLAALTGAAVAMALLTLFGSVALALGRHGAYAGGWLTATLVSCGVLLIGLPLEVGAVVALCTGPLVGAGVHLVAVRSALRGPGGGSVEVEEPGGGDQDVQPTAAVPVGLGGASGSPTLVQRSGDGLEPDSEEDPARDPEKE